MENKELEKEFKWLMESTMTRFEVGGQTQNPIYTMVIDDNQKLLIETIADVETDERMEKVYVINRLRFTIKPKLV